MREFMDALGGPNTAMSYLVPLTFLLSIVAICGFIQWRKYRQAEMEANLKQQVINLKQQMIAQGMSASEIERVLAAQPINSSSAYFSDSRPGQQTVDYKSEPGRAQEIAVGPN